MLQSNRSIVFECIVYTVLGACVLYTAIVTAQVLADRVRAASALHCARTSDGTDQAIATCFEQRGMMED